VAEDFNGSRGLHHLVVQRLGEMIASGELAADSQILPDEICERFGASRSVVREALRVLEAKGMLRPRPKTGTRVLPISHWNLLDQEVIGWRVLGPDSSRQLEELSDLRVAVETHAARRAAEHASDDQIAELEAACDRMESTGLSGDLSGFTAADVDFHTALLSATGNQMLAQFSPAFGAYLHAREHLHTLPDRVDDEVLRNHRQLVDAIRKRDPQAAEARSRELIENARAEVDQALRGRARS
jgi:DNA-binding FadR family transcriptional regulator